MGSPLSYLRMAAYSGLYHLSGMSENDAISHPDGCVQNRAGHAVADFVGTAYFNSDHSPAHSCPPLPSLESRGEQVGAGEWSENPQNPQPHAQL